MTRETFQFWPPSAVLMRVASAGILASLLFACAGIKGTTLSTETLDQVAVQVHQSNLTEAEKTAFDEVKARADNGEFDVTGKTIGQVIQDQQAFDADQKAQQARAAALAAQVKQRHDEAVKRLARALTVALVDKGFRDADFMNGEYKSFITLEIAFHNNTGKPIQAVKGTMDFTNSLGDTIHKTGLEEDIRVYPGHTYLWFATVDYNEFESSLARLKEASLRELHLKWEPQTILFTDGSKLEVTE